jgi:Sulfotransferase family
VERDELQQLLRAASEEHERTRELLGAHGGAAGLPADAVSGETASPEPARVASSLLEARLVWIFGSPRSGSSWLMSMLSGRSEVATINESYLGVHLVPMGGTVEAGEYFEHGERAKDPSYFFARRYLPVFRPLLRELVLQGLENQLSHLRPGLLPRWVAIKEPNGSHAADTVISLLPSSRMLFLLRDGRDVVDSLVDAMLRDESWWRDKASTLVRHPQERVPFVSQHAALWVARTMASQRAFAALPDQQRLLVRYEELLSDTPAQLRRIFDWLDIDASEGDVEAIVARDSLEAVPKDRRGPGKPVRAATPGLWRENLTPNEQEAMHEIMGDKLRELGYEA